MPGDQLQEALDSLRGKTPENAERDRIQNLLTRTIHVDHVDVFSGKHYKADLEFVVPDMKQKLEIERLVAYQTAGSDISVYGAGLARMWAWIYVCIKERPEWLKDDQVRDEDVIEFIWKEMQTILKSFREPNRNRGADKAVGEVAGNKTDV